ncbi:hypothetical protein DPMN_119681 [Dreissena polymorpha]|uniref:Uncharacterized protein n=1 Tax=Dreissena polymorpha TaxID=45954 RepID=A0A9D4GMT5_DREPO|nr:hypothetical protein DPMN_119681 [Dreissena polymorpha]
MVEIECACLHPSSSGLKLCAGFLANLEIRENLEKDFHLFQPGKSQGVWEKFLKLVKNQGI